MSVSFERSGDIVTVGFNRPDKRNAINLEMREQLVAAFRQIAQDDNARAIVLTGAGGHFSAGADVAEMGGGGVAGSISRMRSVHETVRAVALCDKPVVAAVVGACAGVAWSLALCCDFVIAGQNASFRFAFRQLGLAPDGASPFLLSKLLGQQRAKELIYTGRAVAGAEAAELGLALRVLPDDDVLTEAVKFARELAAGPTLALTRAKRMFRSAATQSFEEALASEADIQPMIAQSEDYAEGRAAFRERRAPVFTGR